jgi:hypothetical protein
MSENSTALIAPGFGARSKTFPAEKLHASDQNIPLGYLRAFITLLVVGHHSVLAYHPFAPPPPASLIAQPRLWQAFPVVDPQRSGLFALFVGFNDTFFMTLMFLLSGLFVWQSLQGKGSAGFVRGRLLRLGLPFLVSAAVLSPLAYFPTYLQTAANPTLTGFWQQWRMLGQWPTGPAWFLWVLLAFDCLAAALFAVQPRWAEALRDGLSGMLRRPFKCFCLLAAASALAYLPMVLKFTSLAWTSIGPFTFQTSRIFHYVVYFLMGLVIGARGFESTFLAPGAALARQWPSWAAAAPAAFALAAVVVILAIANPAQHQTWELLGGIDLRNLLRCLQFRMPFSVHAVC